MHLSQSHNDLDDPPQTRSSDGRGSKISSSTALSDIIVVEDAQWFSSCCHCHLWDSWSCARFCSGCCRCCGCCGLILLGVVLLRFLAASLHSCGLRPWNGMRGGGSISEWMFLVAHLIGARNLYMFMPLLPGYSRVHFAAQAHPDGMQPRCAVTIDDAIGESPYHLEELLSILKSYTVNATFFIIANEHTVQGNGSRLLRQIVDAGHEIGNHGLRDSPMNSMSEAAFRNAVLEWEARIHSILPRWPVRSGDWKWFRAPSGVMSKTMATVLEELDYETAACDVYSDDAHINNAEFHSRIISGSTCDGSIILLHNPDVPARLQTLHILRTALPRLRDRGFSFLRMTDMFAAEQGFSGPCGIAILGRLMLAMALCMPLALCLLHLMRLLVRHAFGVSPLTVKAGDEWKTDVGQPPFTPGLSVEEPQGGACAACMIGYGDRENTSDVT